MAVWLLVMAVALALAIGTWIFLVFHAQSHEPRQMHESYPDRDVNGGKFRSRSGGRQLMPDPREPLVPEDESRGQRNRP